MPYDKKQSKIMQKFILQITNEDFNLPEQIKCVVLSETLPENFISEFVQKARRLNKLILANGKELCQKFDLDGAIFDFTKSENIASDYADAVQGLKGKVIGGICRGRRHEAMLLSECEPDFVIFKAWKDGAEKIQELTDWYNEFFLLQSALLPMDQDLNFSGFKTDFVIINDINLKKLVAKV